MPNIQLKVLPRFPAQILGTPPIVVTKSGVTTTISFDGITAPGIPALAVTGANSSFLKLNTLEGSIETITPGFATFTSALQIPAKSMVIGVSHLVIAGITGSTQFEIGTAASPALFATLLATAAGSNNAGIGGPNTFIPATSLFLTSTAGGNFTGGTIRLTIQYFSVGPPTS